MRFARPLCLAAVLAAMNCGIVAAREFQAAKSLRRPVAMALSADESLLYVANRDSGTVSTLDAKRLKLLGESPIGQRLSDIARVAGQWYLAADEAAHELILLKADGPALKVAGRLKVSPYPVCITVADDGATAYVSSLWSRRVSLVDLRKIPSIKIATTIDLPFAPNKLLLVDDGKHLIVADNFAGRFGIVDCQSNKLVAVRTFYAENIRGLAVDPQSKLLAVSHSMLNEYAHTVRNDVHWGVLMSNDLRWLHLPEVLDPDGDFYNKGHMHPLGEPGMGGAEPGELAFFTDGTIVVPMAGVNKVAFGKEGDFGLHRIDVGRGPTTVVASDKHRRAFVANTFGDSISAINMETMETVATVPLGPQRELTPIERGEMLFHDGRLSHDGWMTCNTCHTGGHTNGGLNDNFSDKSFGAPKRVLSLLGAKDTAPYAWNGQTASIEDQIHKSNTVTMQGPEANDEQVAALAAYIRSLEPPPSVDALRGTADPDVIARGKTVFAARACADCHTPPVYTSDDVYDVGIHDSQGNTQFNPPSLRGVGQRGPYFHDNSAKTLTDVFVEHGHQLDGDKLNDDDLRALLAFLRSL